MSVSVGTILDIFSLADETVVLYLKHGHGHHDDHAHQPQHADGFVGVIQRLPAAGVEGPADGEVTLQRDGHQRQHADAHRHACNRDTGRVKGLITLDVPTSKRRRR